MRLTVRNKFLLLMGGSLTAAVLLVAVVLAWLIGQYHEDLASERTHGMALEVRAHLLDQHSHLDAITRTLVAREEVGEILSLLADGGDLVAPSSLAHEAKKHRLARMLHDLSGRLTTIEVYDSHARRLIVAGAAHPDAVSLPLPDLSATDAVLTRILRVGNGIVLETMAMTPLPRTLGSEPAQIGWLRLTQPFDLEGMTRAVGRFGMQAHLLFSDSQDAMRSLGLTPAWLDAAPGLLDMPVKQDGNGNIHLHHDNAHSLHVTSISLAGDDRAWLVIASHTDVAREEQQLARTIIFLVLAGSLLLALPLAGWLERRWIGRPFDTIRSGVHEYARGNLERLITLRTGDELESLAEDFNLLAIALRVREIAIREAEERWQFALEGAGHGVWDQNLMSGRVFFSPLWKQMLGHAEHEIGDRFEEWENRLHPEDRTATLAALESHLSGNTPTYTATFRLRHKDGDWRWIHACGQVAEHDQEGKPTRLIGTQTDITERMAAEQAIREAATVFEATGEAIMITDPMGVIKRVNRAFTSITGYAMEEVTGQRPSILRSGRQDETLYKALWQALEAQGHWEGELWNRRKDGQIFPVWETISSVRNAEGKIIEFVAIFADITQKKRSEEEIAYRANYDVLTGLPNRNLLAERLSQAIKQARRENTRIAVMFVDLDHFKQVNDTLGHAIGDLLLQTVADRLRQCVRETDTIARQGGDEFVLLLAGVEDSAAAGRVANKIIEQLCASFIIEKNEIHIGASIGITLYPDDGRNMETLFRNADLAMYRAKDAGRNNAQFFETSMTIAALERRTLEADLRGALNRGEFFLVYQPLIELATGRIIGAEALLRWQHPERGLVPPDRFVPVAEETGLIREIGSWVFAEACRQVAVWKSAGHHLSFAINVSVRQLPEALSVAHILATLQEHGLSPQQVVLEITEGVLLADSPSIREWFDAASDSGLSVAIDDFGTGYSSLAYLKRFPVHHIKIDKAFVRDMTTDPADRALINAILAMAHSLGLAVVAEGVETQAQANLLVAGACEYAQGYLFGRPSTAADFERMLAAQSATTGDQTTRA